MYTRAIPASARIISLIKEAPGIPSLYVRKTDINEKKGINTMKNRIRISKIVVLVLKKSDETDNSEFAIENRKKSCE